MALKLTPIHNLNYILFHTYLKTMKLMSLKTKSIRFQRK